jgi:hypothetical protein
MKLLSDSLESGTGSSNSLRSAKRQRFSRSIRKNRKYCIWSSVRSGADRPALLESLTMESPPKTSWRISARDRAELFSQFGSLGIRVPGRTEPKDQFAEEIYCLRRYLFPLADGGLLRFPITVAKTETPDFLLNWQQDATIGLEVTKATRQEFEADLTRFDRKQETKHYLSDPATGTMDLSVAGWAGNAVEREWVEYILASILEKLEDIDTYSVGGCDLLIYDNTPTGAPDLNMVAEAVRLKLSRSSPSSNNGCRFGVVSVIRDPRLIYNIAGPYRILAYKPEWGIPYKMNRIGSRPPQP